MGKKLFFSIIAILLIGVVAFFLINGMPKHIGIKEDQEEKVEPQKDNSKVAKNIEVTNYEECVTAGFQVSGPENSRCVDSKGTIHTSKKEVVLNQPNKNFGPVVVLGVGQTKTFKRGSLDYIARIQSIDPSEVLLSLRIPGQTYDIGPLKESEYHYSPELSLGVYVEELVHEPGSFIGVALRRAILDNTDCQGEGFPTEFISGTYVCTANEIQYNYTTGTDSILQ